MINVSTINAVKLIKELHANPGMKLAEFAKKFDVSLHYMEQIGRKLVKAGILKSSRGPGGGYRVRRTAIKLDEVVLATSVSKLTNATDEISELALKALSTVTIINENIHA